MWSLILFICLALWIRNFFKENGISSQNSISQLSNESTPKIFTRKEILQEKIYLQMHRLVSNRSDLKLEELNSIISEIFSNSELDKELEVKAIYNIVFKKTFLDHGDITKYECSRGIQFPEGHLLLKFNRAPKRYIRYIVDDIDPSKIFHEILSESTDKSYRFKAMRIENNTLSSNFIMTATWNDEIVFKGGVSNFSANASHVSINEVEIYKNGQWEKSITTFLEKYGYSNIRPLLTRIYNNENDKRQSLELDQLSSNFGIN